MSKCSELLLRACKLPVKFLAFAVLTMASLADASQFDISGPVGSSAFGTAVAVLPNGNVVVTDPNANGGGGSTNLGAVYLYNSAGTLINGFTGTNTNDSVGSGGVVVLSNGNFVVASPNWRNASANAAGAVTWVNGTTGLGGTVSASNSLVGTLANDAVGSNGVYALSNGNYVVASSSWNNGMAASSVGAVTWCNGSTGRAGAVSTSNSLYGTSANDAIGNNGVTVLSNGNYVVASSNWSNGATTSVGAVTWGNGGTGITGAVSVTNSLYGASAFDALTYDGVVAALSNGNYVVGSPHWHNGALSDAGAATWGNGSTGRVGAVTIGNSLVGQASGDAVGVGVKALSNGNYVVISSNWSNGGTTQVGAVTWANGSTGLTVGLVSTSNSLVGSTSHDAIGTSVTALTNGNYVVASRLWNNGMATHAGAATWGNGTTGTIGTVSAANSLVGSVTDDQVGYFRYSFDNPVIALSNGNYVVASFVWNNGSLSEAGAVTWGNGATGTFGAVSTANSLVGNTLGDRVGTNITALSNGNYVVSSPNWQNGGNVLGAVTWANGTTGLTGAVLPSNSLIGSSPNDAVGALGVVALNNGNYVVGSYQWSGGGAAQRGASTWVNGSRSVSGVVSTFNSLVGVVASDNIGVNIVPFSDNNYLVLSSNWHNGGVSAAGVSILASGAFRAIGTAQAYNSVRGGVMNGGFSQVQAYDAVNHQLVVGRPAENIVSLFKMDQIFADSLED